MTSPAKLAANRPPTRSELLEECERLRVVAAVEKKHADDIHEVLGQVLEEAEEAVGRCPICRTAFAGRRRVAAGKKFGGADWESYG